MYGMTTRELLAQSIFARIKKRCALTPDPLKLSLRVHTKGESNVETLKPTKAVN